MSKMRITKAALLFVSATALTAGVAQAQQPANVTDEATTEIIVTVQKRAQRLLNVPVAVTGLDNSFLTDTGVTDFNELGQFVPGFAVQDQSPNNPGFVMRGITSDTGSAVGEARVSVFQDGVSITRSRGSYVELFDLERVEVAKGPQSTLFGRGALIGAVNVVQNKARLDDFSLDAAVSAGNYDFRQVDLAVNLPVSDTFALRLAGRTKHRDGYVDNLLGGEDFNSTDTDALRLLAHWRPIERLRFDLIFNTQKDSPTGTAFKSGTFTPTNPQTGAVIGNTTPYDGAAISSASGFKNRDLGLERTVSGTTLLAEYDINETYSLSSITAHRRFSSSEVFDPDGFSLPMTVFAEDAKGKQWSQELRLNYDAGDRLSWFAGLSYFKEEAETAVPLQINERIAGLFLTNALSRPVPPSLSGAEAVLAAHPLLGSVAPLLNAAHRESSTTFGETESYDIYGDFTYRFTPKFEISAGVRYTQDDKVSGYAAHVERASLLAVASSPTQLAALQQAVTTGVTSEITRLSTEYYIANGTLPPAAVQAAWIPGVTQAVTAQVVAALPPVGLFAQPTANNGDRIDRGFDDDGWTYRLVGRYSFTDTVNGYLSYARGRQPETLTGDSSGTLPGAAPNFTRAEAETVDSVEVGLKTRLFDGRLSWDSAVYHYQYDNFQTSILSESGQPITVSAGEAKAYGLETQAYYRVVPGADLFFTYAYSHARFDNGRFKGNRFRLSPDHSLSLGARLKFDTSVGQFHVTPTYVWQSEVFFDVDNDLPQFQLASTLRPVADTIQDEKQDAYGLLNLRVGYSPLNASWSVEAFGDNLTDEEYIKDAGNTGDTLGIPTFIQGKPRTYGLTLRYRY